MAWCPPIVAVLPATLRPSPPAALAIAYLGLALLCGSWWPLALWPLVIVTGRQLVIRPEERYLIQRLGSAYTDYQSRVRRWL